jgi:hypothetical protein
MVGAPWAMSHPVKKMTVDIITAHRHATIDFMTLSFL